MLKILRDVEGAAADDDKNDETETTSGRGQTMVCGRYNSKHTCIHNGLVKGTSTGNLQEIMVFTIKYGQRWGFPAIFHPMTHSNHRPGSARKRSASPGLASQKNAHPPKTLELLHG